MRFTLFASNCIGSRSNCTYPTRLEIASAYDMDKAVRCDHVCAEFRDSRRGTDNFISSDVVVMDCDNEGSDEPNDWMTPERLFDIMPDIAFITVPSRHDGMEKDGMSARPRFHAYFPISTLNDAQSYAALKRAIHSEYPFFDGNALDAARFIFGSDRGKSTWHDGWMNIDESLPATPSSDAYAPTTAISQGCRNNTLSRFAGRVLKRYGDSDRAYSLFLGEADRCDPPLEDAELKAIWESARRFFERKVSTQEGYISPEQYNNDFDSPPSLRPEDYSDIGQAKVLSREYRDELRYTDGTDYIRFDGGKWNESRQQSIAAAEEFLDMQLEDAREEARCTLDALTALGVDRSDAISGGKKLMAKLDGKQLKAYEAYLSARSYMEFVMQRRNMKYIVSALQAAKPMLEIDLSELDKDEFLLNTPTLTYDLRKGMDGGREPDAEDLITKQTAVSPSDEGAELWKSALDLFFCGDDELIAYVQEIAGLAAIGRILVEAMVIAYGEGSNGKSTFWNTISRVLGSYSGAISADALTVGCKRNVKPEMAELKGKRLVIAAELEEGMRLNTSVIKQLCSTDEIQAEKKYKDPFRFTPSHTLVLYTNHLPRVGANDAGTWRRLIVIPFNAKISGGGDVKNYSDHLFRNAGPAVLKWIIEGAEKAIGHGYHLEYPKCVMDAISAYRENNDWLGAFLDECCELDPTYRQKSGELYQSYRAYCLRIGEYARSTTDFYSALETAGFERKKTKTGKLILGLRLKEEFLG